MTQTSITRSWVASANGHADFPLQNLPLGVFSLNGSAPRSGVAIGEHIFDLQAALEAGSVRWRREDCRRSHPWRPAECVLRTGP